MTDDVRQAAEITEDFLASIGGNWDDNAAAHCFRQRRLAVWVRVNGQWWMDFDSTRGGTVGTYRRLKTQEEVKQALTLLGIQLKESEVGK